jgi:peptide/nickel transport system permease protein
VIAFIIRRMLQAVVVVFGITIIVFILIHFLPGGPAKSLLGPRATPEQVKAFNIANGYNKPIYVQYVDYIGRLLHDNLGYSYHYNESVNALLSQNLPKSALLVGLSVVAALIIAIPLGFLQAVRRNKPIDYVVTGAAFVGYAMPVFWLGILLILFFAVKFNLFPAEGPQGATVGAILGQPMALVLPVATLTLVTVAQFSRFMRSAAIDNMVQDYVRTARAKGVSEQRILFHHVLRNSMIPIITLLGISLPTLLSGAVVTESVFNYPGMGFLFWTAAQVHDYPTMLGFIVVVGAATVLGSLVADVLYAFVDPRVRYA